MLAHAASRALATPVGGATGRSRPSGICEGGDSKLV